jgi:tetratricopeptide (TPR) repeat protein
VAARKRMDGVALFSGSGFSFLLVVIVVPNSALRALLGRAGWTGEELARAVNAAGAENGLSLRYDRTAVSHWLAGRRPWAPVPGLIAEALSRRLDMTITLSDAGFQPDEDGQPAPRDILAALEGSGDAGDRVFSLAALDMPSWSDAVRAHSGLARVGRPSPGVTVRQIDAAEQFLRVFADAESAFGGGYVREPLAAYLACDLVPRLRAGASSRLRPRLLRVAHQMAYLCGFACFDDERHQRAQRYYLVALDLAAANNDTAGYAVVLRALSRQASSLGHHREALAMAEAAAGLRAVGNTAEMAFLRGQVAVAAAGNGDRVVAAKELSAAEHELERSSSGAGTLIGEFHQAAFAHQEYAVRVLLGDRAGAITALETSLRHRPVSEHRIRAITTAKLAEARLAQGHLEEAVIAWNSFLDDYPSLRSGRATTSLKNMRASLRPYAGNPLARRLLARNSFA